MKSRRHPSELNSIRSSELAEMGVLPCMGVLPMLVFLNTYPVLGYLGLAWF